MNSHALIICLLSVCFLLTVRPLALCAQEQELVSSVAHTSETPQPTPTSVQRTPDGWRQYLEELSEMEDFESADWEAYEETLQEYAEHPVNINTATREDLERLPFLTARQVEDILTYLYRYGEMKSLGELAMISSLSWYQRQLLAYFVYPGEGIREEHRLSLKTIAQYGKHEVVAAAKIPLYSRAGDKTDYQGYPYKHWLRYQFRYSNRVKFGFVGSQDAGEPFLAGKNKQGYDFYSFYFQWAGRGLLKNLTLGRYRLRQGMGLILNNDFSFGKLSVLSTLGRTTNTIRVHSSRSSANYLQGAAATVGLWRGLDLSLFLSARQIDATVKNGGIATILTTGLHRTATEMAKKDVAWAYLSGGNLSYRLRQLHIGATGFVASYSLPLEPNKKPLYKRHAPEGSRFWNASVDYSYTSGRLSLAGETATGNCGTVATINTASYRFSPSLTLMALQRFYPARYYSLYSNTFSEGSSVQDESGVYVGASWAPNSQWLVTLYTDFVYFAWPKYQTTSSTSSWDNMLNLTWRASSVWTLGGRYRFKRKQGTDTQRLRLYSAHAWTACTNRLSVDFTSVSKQSQRHTGYMLSDNFSLRHRWLRMGAYVAYFHTDDYSSRIYSYEPGMLYTMSSASYYGHGMRCALVARAEVGRQLLFIAKCGTTKYFDRDHISSGLQQIDSSRQTDVEIQVKWKF